jgi:hypothetical protein
VPSGQYEPAGHDWQLLALPLPAELLYEPAAQPLGTDVPAGQ